MQTVYIVKNEYDVEIARLPRLYMARKMIRLKCNSGTITMVSKELTRVTKYENNRFKEEWRR